MTCVIVWMHIFGQIRMTTAKVAKILGHMLIFFSRVWAKEEKGP